MLPTTGPADNNDANSNAEFVADNRLAAMDEYKDQAQQEHENGKRNIEAETNKPYNDNYMTENYDGTTDAMLEQSQLGNNDRLSIESNEEYAIVNDNLNESTTSSSSSEDFAATNHTKVEEDEKEKESLQVSEQDDLNENFEFVESTTANAEFNVAPADAHHYTHNEDENEENDDRDKEFASEEEAAVHSSAMYSNYAAAAAAQKQREDDASSADENDNDEDKIEMHAAFNSEWENLAEDLANINDRNNVLNNDIDVYEASLPLDLSNDIAVNDLVAAQPGFSPDPDAEFIDVNGDAMRQARASMQPKFEKLTINGGASMVMANTMSYPQASVK